MDLRDGRNNVPAGPSDTVFIDKNTPTTDGVVFDPNTPALTDTLYVSSTNGSTWIYNGSAYTTYTAPAVQATPFFIAGTDIDAGSNKKAIIERSGEVRVKNSTVGKIKTISGTRSLLLSSYVSSRNEILSTGDQLWLGTSDNNPFYLRTNGVERLRVLGTGAIRFNQAYSFPTTDGTVGQVLKTDGAGVVSFGTAAGGLTYFTEAQNTTAPNATVPVDSLTAVTATTNGDIAIVPKGSGAILRQIPNNAISGGNKRGANAIDFQYSRTASTQVASGAGSIAFGTNNTISGLEGLVIGNTNVLSGDNSYIFGQTNTSLVGYDFATAFGTGNAVNRRSSFASGTTNTIASRDGATFGNLNNVSADYSYAFGVTNSVSSTYCMAIGLNNNISAPASIGLGNDTYSETRGKLVVSSGKVSVNGDSQLGLLTLSNRTTDATPTRLYAYAISLVASTQLSLRPNQSIRFRGTIIGKQSGSTNTSAWDIDGIVSMGATAATIIIIGAVNVNVISNIPAWGTPTIVTDTTLGCINISVIGALATNIQWVCRLDTIEVIYA